MYILGGGISEDANLIFAHGDFDYHMGDHYDQSKRYMRHSYPQKMA